MSGKPGSALGRRYLRPGVSLPDTLAARHTMSLPAPCCTSRGSLIFSIVFEVVVVFGQLNVDCLKVMSFYK